MFELRPTTIDASVFEPCSRSPSLLLFSHDSVLDSVLVSHPTCTSAYTLISSCRGARTTLARADGPAVAIVDRSFAKTRISTAHKRTKASNWIRPKPGGKSFPMQFDANGCTFEWREQVGGELALCVADLPTLSAIAWYSPARRRLCSDLTQPAFFALSADFSVHPSLTHAVLASWLVVEGRRRHAPRSLFAPTLVKLINLNPAVARVEEDAYGVLFDEKRELSPMERSHRVWLH